MNKLSKIAYSIILVFILFLLPVSYANSQVLVSVIKDEQKISSAEAGSIVTVSADIENPKEGDIVTFKCTNSTLSFIDEKTGKEYEEDELVQKEITINKDGSGKAEVSAKVLTNAQIDVDATITGLDPESTEEESDSGEGILQQDTEKASNDNTETSQDLESDTKSNSEEIESSTDTKTEKDSINLEGDQNDQESTVKENSQDDEKSNLKSDTNQTEESDLKSETNDNADSITADKEVIDENDSTGESLSSEKELSDDSTVKTEESDDSKETSQSEAQATENKKASIERLKIKANSLSVKTGDVVNLSVSSEPEVGTDILDNVVWTISYSNKEIIPNQSQGSSISFTIPEDASGRVITVSAYLPKEVLGIDEDLHAKDVAIGALSEDISVGIYASTDSKRVAPLTDLGFSSEILDGKYVADPALSENAKYTWYAQLGSSYINGTSFGTTYSVRPEDEGKLKVWVSVTLKNGSIVESKPIEFTISNSQGTDLESIEIKTVDENRESYYVDEQIEFTNTLIPEDPKNLDGAEYTWIAKLGEKVIAESDSKDNFKFKSPEAGKLTVSLTITPKDEDPIVSNVYELEVESKTVSEDEPQQMIPENQVKIDKSTQNNSDKETSSEQNETQNLNKSQENTKQDNSNQETNQTQVSQTQEEDTQSQKAQTTDSQAQDETESVTNSSLENNTVNTETASEDSKSETQPTLESDENPLKLKSAEIVSDTDLNQLEIGKKVTLNADIETEGGAGKVSYHWTAIDAEGKTIAMSEKLNNFSFTTTKPTDVTAIFEMSIKDPKNIPDEFKNIRAEKTISFKSPEAIAEGIKSTTISPESQTTNSSTLVAQDLKPVENNTESTQNLSTNYTATTNNNRSISTTDSSTSQAVNTTRSTSNKIGNSSKQNTSSTSKYEVPSLESYRSMTNTSSNTKKQTPNNEKQVTRDIDSTKSLISDIEPVDMSSLFEFGSGSKNVVNQKPITSDTTAPVEDNQNPSAVENLGKNIESTLSAPSGLINPRTGDPFSVGEVGTVATILAASICALIGLGRHKFKEDDSKDYYL